MFWTLDHCLGNRIYNSEANNSWTKIFSHMLAVIVPLAVSHELAGDVTLNARSLNHKVAFCYNAATADIDSLISTERFTLPNSGATGWKNSAVQSSASEKHTPSQSSPSRSLSHSSPTNSAQ